MALGEVRPDDPALEERLGYLRATALGMEPHGMRTQLVIPDSEILYTEVAAPGPTDAERRAQIEAALDGATPYAVADLVYDWSDDGPQLQLAVVARETLQEAEEFAATHRLSPFCFAAAPEDEAQFDGAPFFGTAAAARAVLADDAAVTRDPTPARPSGRAELPSAALTDTGAGMADGPPEAGGTESGAAATQTFRSRRTAPPPADSSAPKDAGAGEAQKDTAAQPAGTKGDAATGTAPRRDLALAAPTSAPAAPPPKRAARSASEAEAMTIFGARPKPRPQRGGAGAPRRWPLIAGLALVIAAAVGLWAGFLWWTDPARLGDMVDTAQDDIARAIPDASDTDADTPAAVPEPVATDTDAAPPDAASEDPAPAGSETADAPAPAPSTMLDAEPTPRSATPQTDTTTTLPGAELAPRTGELAALPDGDEMPPPEALPQFDTDGALADLLSEADPAADDGAAAQAGPDIASAAPAISDAARGAGRSAPTTPAGTDPPVASLDAFALPQVAGDRPVAPPPLVSPPPFGTQFALDPRGLVEATEEGALSPEGVRITAGQPAQVPPARAAALTDPIPVFGADPDLVGLRPEPRPAAPEIPEAEDEAAADIDASAEPRLQELPDTAEIPAPPPRAEDLAAAPEDPFAEASTLAVAAAPRPSHRPAGFTAAMRSARAAEPEAQPQAQPEQSAAPASAPAQQPSIPTRASVANAATEQDAINLRRMTLIGVFGSSANRRALMRLPNGRMVRVQTGDTVDGGRVAAIGENRVQYVKNGRNTVLEVGTDG